MARSSTPSPEALVVARLFDASVVEQDSILYGRLSYAILRNCRDAEYEARNVLSDHGIAIVRADAMTFARERFTEEFQESIAKEFQNPNV